MNIQPQINTISYKGKINNAEEIRSLAKDVIRMARNDHPMLQDTYTNFVNASLDNPSFGLVALRKAEFDSYKKMLLVDKLTRSEVSQMAKNTKDNLAPLENGKIGMVLHDSLRKFYPKTFYKRSAIALLLGEASHEFNPTSNRKFLKKIFAKVFKTAAKV